MRSSCVAWFTCTLLWLCATTAAAGPNARWCRVCHHGPSYGLEGFGRSAHGELDCSDCHEGFQFNPHEKVVQPAGELFKTLEARKLKAPAAQAACSNCHDARDKLATSRHGKRFFETPDGGGAPYCVDCHGDPHTITKTASASPSTRRLAFNQRCSGCHGDPDRMKAAGLPVHVVATYEASMHGRKLRLGSSRAPGCTDCHGSHEHTNMQDQRPLACNKCHTDANLAFSQVFDHQTEDQDAKPIVYYTKKFFIWLTFLTIFALVLHVMLDFVSSIRSLRRRNRSVGG